MTLFQKIFDLQSAADPSGSIERIKGFSISGYNIWLLFCSVSLASIGLDTKLNCCNYWCNAYLAFVPNLRYRSFFRHT
jgi:hypothetical protein